MTIRLLSSCHVVKTRSYLVSKHKNVFFKTFLEVIIFTAISRTIYHVQTFIFYTVFLNVNASNCEQKVKTQNLITQ